MKKIISVMLALLIIAGASVLPSSAAETSLSYSFAYSDRGFAQGTISLKAPAGTYWLYWADDEKALDGYYQLSKLTLSSEGTKTHKLAARTAIPADATKLVAFKSVSEPSSKAVKDAAAVYTIPAEKRLLKTSAQRGYRFASYSDVHIDGTRNTYKYAETHWRKALDTAAARDADFLVLSGDYVNNNCDYPAISAKEWDTYQKILADSDFCNPVYEAIGNHELWQDVQKGTNDFIYATGLGGSVKSAPKAYFEKDIKGDHFIFMSLEGGFYPNEVEEFSDEQLNWLEGLLKKYSGDGKNIYIIEHSLFYKYGAGDTTTRYEPYYDIPLGKDLDSTRRFKGLLEKYKDVIFLSGHTHIAFSEQYNFSDNGGTSAQMIHNSSVGGTRHIIDDKLNYDYYEDQTEGYIVDVFDDAIIFNGANLYYNMYDPNCCYIVKPSAKVAEAETPAPTDAAESQSTEPTETSSSATATGYYLKGEFNSWSQSNPFYTTSDSDIISTTLNLSSGTYEFKINSGSVWYGNSGTFTDTTKTNSNGGWLMGTGDGNCTIIASGGTYTFTFNLSSKKMNVLYSGTGGTVEPTESSSSGTPTSYYLKGQFNNWSNSNPFYTTSDSDIISTTLNLSAGTYEFKINSGSVWYGNSGTFTDTTKTNSNGGWLMGTGDGNCTIIASGGTYTFTFNLSSKKMNVLYSASPKSLSSGKEVYSTAAKSAAVYGDVDGNDVVDVNDATLIQRRAASLVVFSEDVAKAADVDANGTVDVNDATLVQRFAAKIISVFPADEQTEEENASAELVAAVGADLSKYYRFSSYDSYQALKKLYRAAENGESVGKSAMQNSYDELMSVVDKDNVPDDSESWTVYFENTNNWKTVNAYVWGNNGMGYEEKWPGKSAELIGKNDQQKEIYKYTFPSKYSNIIFTNGSEQTVDISVYENNMCYYLSDSASPYYVKSYKFKSSYLV